MAPLLERLEGLSGDLSDRVASLSRDLEGIRKEIGALSADPPPKTAGAAPRYHRVKKGESLYSIARRHGTSVAELCRLNGIRPERFIHPGQRLIVPAPGGP